jgi:DNA polymerase-3 subunit epsilon
MKKYIVENAIDTSEWEKSHRNNRYKVRGKDITTEKIEFDETHPLFGKVCVFTGTLNRMGRKEAMQIVKDFGGELGDSVTRKTNFLILGETDYAVVKNGKSSKHKKAEELRNNGFDIEIISENVFYDMVFDE